VRELDQLLRQHGELEAKHRAIERELEMAARIQRSLLSERFPELSGFRFANLYEPCEALGGDFFDVMDKDDGAVLLVSDVIGHGVQAALTTMFLKGVFQESADRIDEPTELLGEMNRRLHAVLPSGMYAAAAVFYLSSGSDHIAYANAGLPYPFVLRKEKRLDEIVLPGAPLGLLAGNLVSYESRQIVAETGDVVVVGSDGIGAVVAGDGAMFEDEELRKTLEELSGRDGATIIEEALKRALAFGNNAPLPDDVMLVAMTRT